jgi:ATP-dependent helicase/nuclease subunit A
VSALAGDGEASTLRRSDGDRSSRWIGILVHRLLQREEFITEPRDDDLRRMAETMLDAAVLVELEDPAAVIECAVTSFQQISSRAELRDLYRSGRPYHEVPFTMAVAGRVVRGTIDCLITSNEKVTVLEFKTGRPHPEHQAQAEVYRAAAQALFPAVPVESRLVYTSDPVA